MFCATSNQKGPGRYEIWLVCIQVHQWLNLFLYFCIFFFFLATMLFWSGLKLYLDNNFLYRSYLQEKLIFFDCHSQLVNYWRSGMVRQVGRHLHSTSDDLKMRLKNELFFQMGPFLKKKKKMCAFTCLCSHSQGTHPQSLCDGDAIHPITRNCTIKWFSSCYCKVEKIT